MYVIYYVRNVRMYVRNVHMYVCNVRMYVCMYVRIYVRMYVCTYVSTYVCMYVRSYSPACNIFQFLYFCMFCILSAFARLRIATVCFVMSLC
jgi:hypothetical protein